MKIRRVRDSKLGLGRRAEENPREGDGVDRCVGVGEECRRNGVDLSWG